MKKSLITILTVNYNTADFIALMLYSFSKLTDNSYKVIICDNGSTDKEILKLAKIVQKYENIEIILRKQSSYGSIGHAEAMDLLVSKVETKYFVTMDSDAVFLCKSWDNKLLSQLNETTKVIGTALPPIENTIKPIDFPLVFAVMYETETFKKLNPSFLPGDLSKDKAKDTGWEIREKYQKNGFPGVVFESKNTRYTKDTEFKNLFCAVYYLNNTLIVSHFGRGSNNGQGKYRHKTWLRIPFVSQFIRLYIGLKEKQKWIHICKTIIVKETNK